MTVINLPAYKRVKMYPKQEAIIDSKAKFVFSICSTKSGKTFSHTCLAIERSIFTENLSCLWISPTREQSRISFNLAKKWLNSSPLKDYYQAKEQQLNIEFLNGSKICYRSSKFYDNIYGFKYNLVICDEFSRFSNAEETWAAVLSTTSQTNAQIFCIGNMINKNNFYYRLYNDAKAGIIKNAECHQINCQDAINAGILKQEVIDVIKTTMATHLFEALYYNIPSEEDGANPFGINQIYKCQGKLSNKKPVVFGVDLGKKHDKTCIIGLDEDKKVCSYHSWTGPWRIQIIKIMKIIGDTYTLIDSTGMGDKVVEDMQVECPNVEGFLFTGASKPKLIEALVMAIQNENITYPEGDIVDELCDFEYKYTKSGHIQYGASSGHDDAVIALSLANMAFIEADKTISWDDVLVKI